MQLSKHLTLEEATYSNTARSRKLSNTPPLAAIDALKDIGVAVYDPIVDTYGQKVLVTSGYRSAELNRIVGGRPNSAHRFGQALDLDGDADETGRYLKISNIDLFNFIFNNLAFDQLIAEYEVNEQPRWIHVSYKRGSNRKSVRIAVKNRYGRTEYLHYTPTLFDKIYKGGRRNFSGFGDFELYDTDTELSSDENGEQDGYADIHTEFEENKKGLLLPVIGIVVNSVVGAIADHLGKKKEDKEKDDTDNNNSPSDNVDDGIGDEDNVHNSSSNSGEPLKMGENTTSAISHNSPLFLENGEMRVTLSDKKVTIEIK